MRVPLEITFRGISSSEEIKELIQQKAAKLERVADQLISCRVAVEKKQKNPQSGNPFRIRINMRLPPGREVVVDSGESGDGYIHDELSTVIRDVFDIALRRLKKINDQLQNEVKEYPIGENSGTVVRLFSDNGYGFIQSPTGREIFFHRNSVPNDGFDRMEVGTGVRFMEEQGEKGPRASSVQLME